MAVHVGEIEEMHMRKLAPADAARSVMQLPARQRVAAILDRADAEAVAAAMPEEDFYFTLKELGPDDSLPLLALADTSQLNFVFDLEWWKKDQIQPAKAAEWMERLSTASGRKLIAWLYQADFELLSSLMKKLLRVVVASEDIDILEEREYLPPHTLDDQYFWESAYPQYEALMGNILRLLFEVNYGFYRELLNSILWAVDSEVEEEAYRFHRGRLEDRAIPDYFDAIEIYRFIRAREIPRGKEPADFSEGDLAAPSFALVLVPEEDLLHRALREIDDPHVMDTLRIELASLSNKVVVADQLSIDDSGTLRFTVEKAVAYVNLGLEVMSGGNWKVAAQLLHEVFLEHLFRLGQTQVAQVRSRMKTIVDHGWIARWPAGINILDSIWMEATELLLQKTPQLVRRPAGEEIPPREDLFREKADLARGSLLVDTVATIGEVFDALRIEPQEIGDRLWKEGQIRTVEDITLGALIWTAAANFVLSGKWVPEPIPVEQWPALVPQLTADVLDDAVHGWMEQVIADSAARSHTRAYLAPLFKQYSEEMASCNPESPPDPRHTHLFLFTEPS